MGIPQVVSFEIIARHRSDPSLTVRHCQREEGKTYDAHDLDSTPGEIVHRSHNFCRDIIRAIGADVEGCLFGRGEMTSSC